MRCKSEKLSRFLNVAPFPPLQETAVLTPRESDVNGKVFQLTNIVAHIKASTKLKPNNDTFLNLTK